MMGETALGEFEKGCNNALFLEFAERCKYMTKRRVEALNEDQLECSHPGNRFLKTYRTQGESESHTPLPNCALEACPIFQSMKIPRDYAEAFEQFWDRLATL